MAFAPDPAKGLASIGLRTQPIGGTINSWRDHHAADFDW